MARRRWALPEERNQSQISQMSQCQGAVPTVSAALVYVRFNSIAVARHKYRAPNAVSIQAEILTVTELQMYSIEMNNICYCW